MLVRATALGYYDHKRRHPGSVFEMGEQDYAPKDKDGKPVLDRHGEPKVCSWAEQVDEDELPPEPKPRRPSKGHMGRDTVSMKQAAKTVYAAEPTGDRDVL